MPMANSQLPSAFEQYHLTDLILSPSLGSLFLLACGVQFPVDSPMISQTTPWLGLHHFKDQENKFSVYISPNLHSSCYLI